MKIRRLREEDVDAVQRIETLSMQNPWSITQLAAEVQSASSLLWVAETDGHLNGYALFKTYTPECELLRLAVAPSAKRTGTGTALLKRAFDYLSLQGFTTCFLEVRSSNEPARNLYEKTGFVSIGCRTNYYNHPVEDAMLFRRDMDNPSGETS